MARRIGNEQELAEEEKMKLKNINVLKNQYAEYIRSDFLETFKVLYCKSSMNDPYLNKLFKTDCNHQDTKINYKHYEIVMYIKNIIAWLDPKMDYCDDDSSTTSVRRIKTSFIHDEEHISRVCLHNTSITEPGSSKSQSTCDNGTSENILDSTKVNTPPDVIKFQKRSNSISRKKKLDIDSDIEHISKKKKVVQNNINDVNNSDKISNDSTKKSINNIYKKNSKEEKNLPDACLKNNSNKISNDSTKKSINNIYKKNSKEEKNLPDACLKNNSDKISNYSTKKNINNICKKNSKEEKNLPDACLKNNSDKISNDLTKKSINYIYKKNSKKEQNLPDACLKSNSDKISNDSTKKSINNMYKINSKGETNLHDACRKGKLDVVTKLLSNGFNPNVKDNAGWTPLHDAVKSGHYQIIKKLIDYGAYLNVPGFEYETPLHTAIYYNKFDIALLLYHNGADVSCMNMYGINLKSLNEEKWSQLIKSKIPCVPSITKYVYESNQITIFVCKVSFTNDVVEQFCEQFNIKLVQNILRLKENELKQVTHIILPETENNICDVNMETLTGIANGLFMVNQRWVSDSLEQNKLLSCENYEISGTTNYVDYNGPKLSRINKEKLYPKLFDGISIYLSGSVCWESFSPEQLQELIVKFGAKLLKRMPSPGNCNDNIFPYHCRNNMEMCNVSTIVLYTIDSNRLIKYNMKHLKAFPVSWFMEAIQKYTIP